MEESRTVSETIFWGGAARHDKTSKGRPSIEVYAAGIIGSLWVYGLLQERIMSQPYDGVMFGDSVPDS